MLVTFIYLLILFLILALGVIEAKHIYSILINKEVPYIRSGSKIIKLIVQENIFKNGAIIYDLGCGDGKFLRELEKHGQFELIGFELHWLPYFIGRIINYFSGSKVKIQRKDLFQVNLSEADAVFCYLFPEYMVKLENKFKNELKKNALIVSNTFTLPNWTLEREIKVKAHPLYNLSHTAYIYRV